MTTDPLRIPIGRNITYAVRGMPDVPNLYGGGFLVPTEVSLTYRASEDAQLGRLHAYVKGHWRRDCEEVATDQKLPGQHYYGDPATWPTWLAEEARLHEPVSSAVAQSAPAETALRDRIAALAEDLRYVLDYRGPRHAHERPGVWDTSGKPCEHCARLAAARENLAAYDTDPDVPLTADRPAEEAYRLAVSTALRLGTGATWEAIRDRAEDLTAEVEQLTEASRRLLEQRQEMAAERFAWQERGDRAEARVRQMEAVTSVDRATVLREAATAVRSMDSDYALQEAAEHLDGLAVEADEEREAQAHLDQLADELPSAPAADRAALSARLWAVAEHHIVAEWICCEPLDPTHDLCAKGYAALEMAKALLVDSDPEEAWNPAAPLLDAVLAELRAAASCPDPIECGHEAALGQARATNRRLNLRAQKLESELAAYRKAVGEWKISETGAYVPLRTLAAIAKAAGVTVPDGWELHYERVERLEAAEVEVGQMRERHKASLRRADKVNNELMAEVQRYAIGAERPVLWSVYNRMHSRAAHAEAALNRVQRIARRLAAHAVGFKDVLDASDHGPWAATVGADIAELIEALSDQPAAVSQPDKEA